MLHLDLTRAVNVQQHVVAALPHTSGNNGSC